jgi:hypothetical protein
LVNPADKNKNSNRVLLFVHGRDFKPAADVFRELSVTALMGGIERDYPDYVEEVAALEKRVAYYGDITDDFLKSNGVRYDEALDVGDRKNALVNLCAYEKRKHFGVSRYDRLPGKSAIGEFAADVLGPVLGKLGLSKKLLEKVGMDLGEYWNPDSDFAERIRQRVRAEVCAALDAGKEIFLISHGTGCIVAYDVLWQLSNEAGYAGEYGDRKIDTWITAGAPLGDSMVTKRLLGADRSGTECYPCNVLSWHNLSAEDDFVSHDNTLADDFKLMLKQKQVSFIRDYRIYNLAIRYGKSNPHSSLGYLVHPRMAQILVEWLNRGPVETGVMNIP